MRKLLVVLSVAVMAAIGACATVEGMFEPVSKVEKVEDVKDAVSVAQAAINEARADNAAAKKTIGDRAAAGVWSKSVAQGYLNKTREFTEKIDKAQKALDVGDITNAQTQAEMVKKLIAALSAEVAKQAAKESK